MAEKERRLSKKNDTTEVLYERRVRQLIRLRYDQDSVEAILNNYLSEPDNEEYAREFKELQEYRALCKEQAKRDSQG